MDIGCKGFILGGGDGYRASVLGEIGSSRSNVGARQRERTGEDGSWALKYLGSRH